MRTLKIENQTWQYQVGKSHMVLLSPLGEKSTWPLSSVTGYPQELIDRGRWKRSSDGGVKPRQVRQFIDQQFRRTADGRL